jgi:hypothetical protein
MPRRATSDQAKMTLALKMPGTGFRRHHVVRRMMLRGSAGPTSRNGSETWGTPRISVGSIRSRSVRGND